MKRILTYSLAAGFCAIALSSCMTDKRKPGWEYMPDMAHSVAYDAYSTNPYFKDGMTSRKPVAGTVPLYQGNSSTTGTLNHYTPYAYPNTNEGYDSAGKFLKNPLPLTAENVAEGERLYVIYCSPCHGATGKGDGSIVVNPNIKNTFPPPPSYFTDRLLSLPEGQMYHTVHHGRNLMGSYASQLNNEQIWKVIQHVRTMQQNYRDDQKGTVGSPVANDSTANTAQGATGASANSSNAQSQPK
jgi:mono/diheme cytochrome c family protein